MGLGKLGGKWNQLFFGGQKKWRWSDKRDPTFFATVAVRGKLSVLKGILLILLLLLFCKQFIIERNFILNLFNSGITLCATLTEGIYLQSPFTLRFSYATFTSKRIHAL